MSDSPAHDRPRDHRRFEVSIPVDVSTAGVFVSNHVSNLSRGGLFIESQTPLPLHAEVDLVLKLPDPAATIRARGRVVWHYDIRRGTAKVVPGSGIKLLEIDGADRLRLQSYLDQLDRQAGADTPRHAAQMSVRPVEEP
jgi:uncharacterized protein (TIGR02266 family)